MEKLRLIKESKLGQRIEEINRKGREYDEMVERRNRYAVFLERLNNNQVDRPIIEFHKLIGAYELSADELKLSLKNGVKRIVENLEKTIEDIEDRINGMIYLENERPVAQPEPKNKNV